MEGPDCMRFGHSEKHPPAQWGGLSHAPRDRRSNPFRLRLFQLLRLRLGLRLARRVPLRLGLRLGSRSGPGDVTHVPEVLLKHEKFVRKINTKPQGL